MSKKCWHCGNKSRRLESAFIKFAKGDKWVEKRIWLCSYCYYNLRRSVKKK